MADKSQQTEKPTQRRIKKAREEGRFATSKEFVAGFQFLVIVMAFSAWSGAWFETLKETFGELLTRSFQTEADPGAIVRLVETALRRVFFPLFTAGALVAVVTLGLQFAVTGFGFTLHRLTPKFENLNPISRLKGLPKQNLAAVVQSIVTLVFCSLAFYYLARKNAGDLLTLPLMPFDDAVPQLFAVLGNLLWKSTFIFVVFGCIDFVRQRRRYDAEMRMSKQEIRDEGKDQEGNPAIKARMRMLRNARRRRMMRQVPGATVVVVNPTHFAIALRYDLETMGAPEVVAKGKNYLALRIRKLAEHHGVPIVENPPLAQALYKSVRVGSIIPTHLYRAVAEVLAYAFNVMRR
jgi:flagellar biosynthesis protein FlhB